MFCSFKYFIKKYMLYGLVLSCSIIEKFDAVQLWTCHLFVQFWIYHLHRRSQSNFKKKKNISCGWQHFSSHQELTEISSNLVTGNIRVCVGVWVCMWAVHTCICVWACFAEKQATRLISISRPTNPNESWHNLSFPLSHSEFPIW